MDDILLEDLLHGISKKILLDYSIDDLGLDITSGIGKDELVEELTTFAGASVEKFSCIVKFINEIQSWGKQHIYLFQSDPDFRRMYRAKNTREIQQVLQGKGVAIVMNKKDSLFVPVEEGYELSEVLHEERSRLTISWIEKRIIHSRLEENDYVDPEGMIEYRAWNQHVARGIVTLDWNLSNGQMMIRISQSSRKSNYAAAKDMALEFTENMLGITDWIPRDIRRSIIRIKDSGEVNTKKYNQETAAGGKQSLQSRDRRHSIERDNELSRAIRAIGGPNSSTYGNFFWTANGAELEEEVHTTIDSSSNSFLIYGAQTEDVVRYLIGRIIHFTN